MLEGDFQKKLIEKLQCTFPGCIVIKNDPTYIQGFPDLIFLYEDFWAVLECKKSRIEPYRPNQEYYLAITNMMSFSATIYPENMEEVIYEIQQALRTRR